MNTQEQGEKVIALLESIEETLTIIVNRLREQNGEADKECRRCISWGSLCDDTEHGWCASQEGIVGPCDSCPDFKLNGTEGQ